MSLKNVYKDIQPSVIDNDMLVRIINEQAPKGEAGRLKRDEGVNYLAVVNLRLEFLNILRIDHLWMFSNLTKLSLSNNLIEKMENLNKLVNLKELDLSFNYIRKIENIECLVNMEILTFYHNQISVLENMETLKKIHIFSIGKNDIQARENIFHLRQFKNLRSVNMADNPCAKTEDFRTFVVTFLPQISYYEYKRVMPNERVIGETKYRKLLEEVNDGEKEIREKEAREEAEKEEAEFHAESFIEFLGGRQLFDSLFEKDDDGRILKLIGEEVEEFYKEYEEEFLATTRQLFEIGQEQYEIRKKEVNAFFASVDGARNKNQKKSQEIMEDFVDEKREIFDAIKNMQKSFNFNEESSMLEYSQQMSFYADEFSDLLHSIWKQLMGLELQLFDQIEEANLKFERVLTDLVSAFIEQAQGLFTICRNLECTYMERVNDAALKLMTEIQENAGTPEEPIVDDELKALMEDKEALNNAIGASHDVHMQLIDGREDRLVSRAKAWLSNLVENLTKNEITRNRGKILEINHFLDIQREEFDDLQNAPVGDLMFEEEDDDEHKT